MEHVSHPALYLVLFGPFSVNWALFKGQSLPAYYCIRYPCMHPCSDGSNNAHVTTKCIMSNWYLETLLLSKSCKRLLSTNCLSICLSVCLICGGLATFLLYFFWFQYCTWTFFEHSMRCLNICVLVMAYYILSNKTIKPQHNSCVGVNLKKKSRYDCHFVLSKWNWICTIIVIIRQFSLAPTELLKKGGREIGFIARAPIAAGSVRAICLSDVRISSASRLDGGQHPHIQLTDWDGGWVGVNSQTISGVCPVTPVNPQNLAVMRSV